LGSRWELLFPNTEAKASRLPSGLYPASLPGCHAKGLGVTTNDQLWGRVLLTASGADRTREALANRLTGNFDPAATQDLLEGALDGAIRGAELVQRLLAFRASSLCNQARSVR
jgi:hypothetical protein